MFFLLYYLFKLLFYTIVGTVIIAWYTLWGTLLVLMFIATGIVWGVKALFGHKGARKPVAIPIKASKGPRDWTPGSR